MLRIYNNYLNKDIVDKLLTWVDKDDIYTEKSSSVDNQGASKYFKSNTLIGDYKDAPLDILLPIIEEVTKSTYIIDEIVGIDCNFNFGIHADSGIKGSKPTIAINLGLWQENDDTHTVFYDNYWPHTRSKFVHGDKFDIDTSRYNLAVTNYTDVKNNTGKPFDINIYNKYLKHLPYENLQGLTTHSIIKNTPGSIMIFDRSMLHSSGYSNSAKKSIVIFLSSKNT